MNTSPQPRGQFRGYRRAMPPRSPSGTAGRVLRGLASVLLLVALVFGSPAALLAWGRAGELRRLSPAALTAPDDGSLLLGLVTVIGWIAWLVFTVCVAAEAVNLASGSRLRLRVPGFARVQGLAAGMLVASIALLAPLSGVDSPAQAAAVTSTVGTDIEAGADESPAGGGAEPDAAAPIAGSSVAGTPDRAVEGGAAGVSHLVGPADSMWSLAEHWYGDGTAWRRIVAANPGLDPGRLPVGRTILIPGVSDEGRSGETADPAVPESADEGGRRTAGPVALPDTGSEGKPLVPDRADSGTDSWQGRRVVVRAGDTLSGLARTHLGDAERWPEIWDLNRDLIADPDLIDIGWELQMPAASGQDGHPVPEEAERAGAGRTTEQTEEGRSDPGRDGSPDPGSAGVRPSAEDRAGAETGNPPPAATSAGVTEADRASGGKAAPDRSSGATAPEGGAPPTVAAAPATPRAETSAGVPHSTGLPPTGSEEELRLVAASPVRSALAGLSLFLAGGIAGALVTGRSRQLFSRPVGRRVPVIGEDGARLRALLAMATDVLAARRRAPGPEDPRNREDPRNPEEDAGRRKAPPSHPPEAPQDAVPRPGDGDGRDGAHTDGQDSGHADGPSATTVVLGTRLSGGPDGDGTDEPVLLDLASTAGWLGVDGSGEDAAAMVAGIALSLTCTWWCEGLEVIACGDSLAWLEQTGSEDVTLADHEEVAADLADLVRTPRPLPEEWPPVERVVLMDAAPTRLPDPRLLRCAGVVVVSPVPVQLSTSCRPGEPLWGSDLVSVHDDGSATLGDLTFAAQLVGEPVRRGVIELIATTSRTDTEPAGWWDGPDDGDHPAPRRPTDEIPPAGLSLAESPPDRPPAIRPPEGPPHDGPSADPPPGRQPSHPSIRSVSHSSREVTVSHSTGGGPGLPGAPVTATPMLRLLGPVDLIGARGQLPSRGVRQCLEYCAWILSHPGSGSVRMRDSLMVAEPTRRSNTSRLRRWLGRDDAGRLYLPEAYDGAIRLDDAVGSDWERLQLLISGGIARAGDRNLRAALDLVRGAPLADAAPGQWHWAEEWRVEMMQTVRDIGAELARRATASGDLDTVRLALARALVCCPEDEELLTARIRLAHLAGERSEVERLVYLLSRRARRLGVDLSEETVVLLQEVMEGRPRARVV